MDLEFKSICSKIDFMNGVSWFTFIPFGDEDLIAFFSLHDYFRINLGYRMVQIVGIYDREKMIWTKELFRSESKHEDIDSCYHYINNNVRRFLKDIVNLKAKYKLYI